MAEDEDDRIEMNQAGSAKTVGLLRARVCDRDFQYPVRKRALMYF
jgi:hypothetical protein